MHTDHDDHDDPTRHLISDRELDQLAETMERAEAALRSSAAPDPLAQEIDRLRAASEAFTAWRGAAIPRAWRRRATHTGTAWRRGELQVVARLLPRLGAGRYTLSLEITRRTGAATLTDLLAVTEAFVEAARVERVGAIARTTGQTRVAEWVVRIPAAALRAEAA